MRRAAMIIVPALLATVCGKDSSTNFTPPDVMISPPRVILDLGDTCRFTATVNSSADQAVDWFVQDIAGGDTTYGTIDSSGLYRTPGIEPNLDSLRVTARSAADSSKSGNAWVVLVDPTRIYVSGNGSDASGDGSKLHPYRTITRALARVQVGQLILVRPGDYSAAFGEYFPLRIGFGVTMQGAGLDSSRIIGPGGRNPFTDAALEINGDAITVERLYITSADSNGIGVWVRPGQWVILEHNIVKKNYIGIYASGAGPSPLFDSNRILSDSIGIVSADSCRPIIRNSMIYDCRLMGIDIRDLSQPDFGTNDSTMAGRDTIQECGDYQNHWLIYNGSPDTIWAVGNVWQFDIPENNDPYIYDDEESGGTSGPVMFHRP